MNQKTQKIELALNRLKIYIEQQDFSGYDPYDGLKITGNQSILKNVYLNTAITQFFKRNPVNLRFLTGIAPTKMPKALGIFLQAYTLLAARPVEQDERESHLKICRSLLRELIKSRVDGYSGNCWNFGFNYKQMFLKPTVVITAIIAKGLFAFFQLTGDEEAKKMLISISDFILKDLHITDTRDGICFSYTPIKPNCCYNANMLAAETLARVFAITGDEALVDIIQKAVNFTVAHQKSDGRWNYSIDIETGNERPQVDFHQGYILESLHEVLKLTGLTNNHYDDALRKGVEFYKQNQFTKQGRSFWRWPKKWPTDIHHQAQGIITTVKLSNLNSDHLDFARRIAEWTIEHMQNKKGYFYFRKYSFYTNRTAYMRWAQAWMLLALIVLLKSQVENEI